MEKILKKYTTIPEHLYVNRNADNQLKTIIEEMERPGYVLVARQMGKTNLLFHAQETLQNSKRIFLYIDLSNSSDSEKIFYRNVIDEALEVHEDIFEDIEDEISKIRDKELPPNKEYSRSLRVLLNKFGGDIIIVFDEIDALRTATYSDHIFAQIRSTYFARTNFPIFNHLTYILSGVIDPTELIKDRNKSPFNIGEKIYLNDFTFDEHNLFIEKSKLQISEGNSNEIFSWTNGNPRLTFDICSDIETNIIDGIKIDKDLIENIIRNKYLVNFDIAPIDHIRDRVKSNELVIEAIINIQKGINNISDEVKQKLYLYGVINSSFDEKTVIKNKIISESLSLDWLNTFIEKSQITITYGLAQYTNKEYQKAIETFIQLLDDSNINEEEIETCNYFLGRAYFYLRDFENAQKYFKYSFKDEIRKREATSLLGMCKIKTDFKEATTLLESVINVETNDFAYHNALLNLAINLPKEESIRSYQLLKQLYESTYKAEDTKDNNLNKLRTLALYYQFKIHNDKDEKIKAIEKLQKAREYANESDSLHIIFLQYLFEEKDTFKKELIKNIIVQKIQFDEDTTYPISFSKIHLLLYIDLVFDIKDLKLFNQIIDYSIENLFYKEKNKYDIIYEVSRISETNQIEYLNYLLKYNNDIESSLLLKIFKDSSLYYSSSKETIKSSKYFDKYLELFKEKKIEIDSRDVLLFAVTIKELYDRNLFDEGLTLCSIIEEKIEKLNKDNKLKFERLVIYYWYASIYFSTDNKEEAINYSDSALNLIENSQREKTSMIDEKGLKSIADQMSFIKDSYRKRVPIVSDKKYGRNDKVKVEYTDGVIKEGKYKKFSADIISDRCKVIS